MNETVLHSFFMADVSFLGMFNCLRDTRLCAVAFYTVSHLLRVSLLSFYASFYHSNCYVKVKGLNPLFYVFCLFSLLDPHFCLMRQKNSICNFLQFYFKTCNCFAFSIKKSDTVIGNGSILNPRILLFHSKNSIRKLYLSSHPEQG